MTAGPKALQQLRRLFPNRLPQKPHLRARFRGAQAWLGRSAGGPRVSLAFELATPAEGEGWRG